jgi:two-component system sensor histidine kinase/response regulator
MSMAINEVGIMPARAMRRNAGSHRLKALHRRARLAAAQKEEKPVRWLRSSAVEQMEVPKQQERVQLQRLLRRWLVRADGDCAGLMQEHKALQAEKEALSQTYQQLRDVEQRRQDMVNMLIHDLKAPLATILASMELLVNDYGEAMDEQQRDVVRAADQAAQQMLQLIACLLEVRRLEDGRMPIYLQPLDMGMLLGKLVEQAQVLADQKKVTLRLELPHGRIWAFADASLASRVVVNLLDNAIKFTPAGEQIVVTCQVGEEELTISVADNGPGIPQAQQGLIFDTFTQVSRGSSTQQASVGLGLALCKLAVEAQDGRIWVESEPGSETLFKFTLPVWHLES